MKKIIFIHLAFLSFYEINGQTKKNIEFSLYGQTEKQGDFMSKFGNVASTQYLKLYGKSYGFDFNYKTKIFKKWFAFAGVGYYSHQVDKIRNKTLPFQIEVTGRLIDYITTDSVAVGYSTNRYSYDNITFDFGLEKQFQVNNSLIFLANINYLYCYTFSQKYHIPYNNANFITHNNKGFGSFLKLNLGLRKHFNQISAGPGLILPIYKSWKQDAVFREDPDRTIENWFSGIGVSVNVAYSLNYKKLQKRCLCQ
jgi:hypothetical protein